MVDDSRLPTQSSSGCSWSNAIASSLPSSSSQSRFLRPGGDLTDDDGAEGARVGLELHERGVLGRDRLDVPAPHARPERAPIRVADPVRHRGQQTCAQARDAMAGDELGEVAPVRADVRERPRGAAPLRRPPSSSCRPVAAASPGGRCRAAGAERRSVRSGRARALRGRWGSTGRRTAPPPAVPSRPRRRRGASLPSASRASGFSQTTCLPAASAASASGRWRSFGVQMWTTSISGSRTISSAESKARRARARLLRRRRTAATRRRPPRAPRRRAGPSGRALVR